MSVFTEESVKSNIRVKDGKRVFYLAEGDCLTPSAKEWLRQQRIGILPASEAKPKLYRTADGAQLLEKPEHMTHLQADVLVRKDHPRIMFRGAIDTLEAEILLTGRLALDCGRKQTAEQMEEILCFVRRFIRCDLLGEKLEKNMLCGMTAQQLRERSHHPQQYYDQPHFMPQVHDEKLLLQLNRLRTVVRVAEISTYQAFRDGEGCCTRPDLMEGINRLSSLIWILMIKLKRETNGEQRT